MADTTTETEVQTEKTVHDHNEPCECEKRAAMVYRLQIAGAIIAFIVALLLIIFLAKKIFA